MAGNPIHQRAYNNGFGEQLIHKTWWAIIPWLVRVRLRRSSGVHAGRRLHIAALQHIQGFV
jgi:hypothetical protein